MLSFRLLSVFFSYSPASYAPHRVIRTHAFSGKTTLNFIHLVTISCLFGRAVASVLCLHFVMLNIIEEQMQLKCDREGLTLSLSLCSENGKTEGKSPLDDTVNEILGRTASRFYWDKTKDVLRFQRNLSFFFWC